VTTLPVRSSPNLCSLPGNRTCRPTPDARETSVARAPKSLARRSWGTCRGFEASILEVLNHRGRHDITCMLFECMSVHPLLPYRRGAIRMRARHLRAAAPPRAAWSEFVRLFASPPAPWCVPSMRLVGRCPPAVVERRVVIVDDIPPGRSWATVPWRRYARSHATSARGSSPRDGGGGPRSAAHRSAPARVEVAN